MKNTRGESLGDIKDLMVDLSNGRVAYAVVEFGGLLGFGSKLFAVPLQTLRQNAADKSFTLDTTKAELENAQGFDKEHWPDFADRRWQEAVHKHCDTKPYWT